MKRPGEQEALPVVALFALQRFELGWLLDALRERLDLEPLPELHERWIRARDCGLSAMALMKERSIFRTSAGNWRR